MSDVKIDDRDLTILGIAAAFMILNLGMLITVVVLLVGQAHKADIVYNAECTYKNSLEQQVIDTEKYLALHPNGAPALGLSAGYLNARLQSQKVAVDSLAALRCPKGG